MLNLLKKKNIEKKADFDEEALDNVWCLSFGASSDIVCKTKQELIDKVMADRKELMSQGKGAFIELPYLSSETSNAKLYEWLKRWYNCLLKEIKPSSDNIQIDTPSADNTEGA